MEEGRTYELSRIPRLILVCIFIFINLEYSSELGILFYHESKLQKDINFNDEELSLFNRMIYIGRIVGTFIYMILLTIIDNRKFLVLIALLSSCTLYFSFLFISKKMILYIIRFLLGFISIFLKIYIPVFIDQLGIKPLKTMMISAYTITSHLGEHLRIFHKVNNWRYELCYIGVILLVLAVIIIIFPSKYFKKGTEFKGYYIKDANNKDMKLINSKDDKNQKYGDSTFNLVKIMKDGNTNRNGLLSIFLNLTFMLSVFSQAISIFISDISILYAREYIKINYLPEEDSFGLALGSLIYQYFLASIFGPPFGALIGGSIVSCFGGYEEKYSCIVISLFNFFFHLLFFTISKYFYFPTLLTFYIITYMIYPIITGYTISSLNTVQKGVGYSFSVLLNTIFEIYPLGSPINTIEKFIKIESRISRFSSGLILCLGTILLQFTCYFRYIDLVKKKEKIKKQEEKEMENIEN